MVRQGIRNYDLSMIFLWKYSNVDNANIILLLETCHNLRVVVKIVRCSQKSVAKDPKKHRMRCLVRDITFRGDLVSQVKTVY